MEQPGSSPVVSPISKEERNWAMIAHLSALLVYPTLIGGIVAPLVIWLIRRDDMSFAADQAKETLNFQITVYLVGLVCGVLFLILIGFVLMGLLVIAHVVLTIVAAVKASEGVAYRYPFNLRLIS
jgi:uncharacterized Tic20 family protein